jgi:hypothetical protein
MVGQNIMKNINLLICVLICGLTLLPIAHAVQKHNYIPKEGYVPNKETAISIAIAVWIPIYGKEQIESEKPYSAKLENGIWFVTGSIPEGWAGGVAEAEISKDDGRIIRISHGR